MSRPQWMLLLAGAALGCGIAARCIAAVGEETTSFQRDEAGEAPAVNVAFPPAQAPRKAPFCPAGSGYAILPENYPAQALFVGFDADPQHQEFLATMLSLAASNSPPLDVYLLVSNLDRLEARYWLRNRISAEKRERVFLLFTPAELTLWVQDYFETALRMDTGAVAIVDLPYPFGDEDDLPGLVADTFGLDLVDEREPVNEDPPHNNGDFGGNVEALPGGLLLVGDNMTEPTATALESGLRQQLIAGRVSWLDTGPRG